MWEPKPIWRKWARFNVYFQFQLRRCSHQHFQIIKFYSVEHVILFSVYIHISKCHKFKCNLEFTYWTNANKWCRCIFKKKKNHLGFEMKFRMKNFERAKCLHVFQFAHVLCSNNFLLSKKKIKNYYNMSILL